MQCVYINLKQQTDRRRLLEANFDGHKLPGWQLNRFEAIDQAFVSRNAVAGTLRDSEKACFLSHRAVIRQSVAAADHVLVLEDDAIFGTNSCPSITQIVAGVPEQGWDIIFNEICVPDPHTMVELLNLRRQLARTREVRLLELSGMTFAGATSYIVNRNSKEKLSALLDSVRSFDVPYDLYLRRLVKNRVLRAFAIFPFATSLSDTAEDSDNQLKDTEVTDAAWIAFRKLVWIDREVGRAVARVSRIADGFVDEETAAFAKIFALVLCPHLPQK